MGQNIAANKISIEQDVISAITDGLGKQWQGTGKAIGEILRLVLLDARSPTNVNIISAVSVDKSGGSRRNSSAGAPRCQVTHQRKHYFCGLCRQKWRISEKFFGWCSSMPGHPPT